MQAKINSSAVLRICAALLCLTLAVCAGLITKQLTHTLGNVDQAASNAKDATALARDYLAQQKTILSSEKNQKALEAGYQTPAVLNGTIRLINTQTIPRINQGLDNLYILLRDLTTTNQNLATLIANSDRAINSSLLPELAITAKALGTSVEKTSKAVDELLAKGKLSLDDLHAIMSSPEWKSALKNLETTSSNAVTISGHAATVTGNVAEASAQMPSIATSLEKIARTSSRYSKALLLAQILSTIARAFIH
jgi:hypothetical protein